MEIHTSGDERGGPPSISRAPPRAIIALWAISIVVFIAVIILSFTGPMSMDDLVHSTASSLYHPCPGDLFVLITTLGGTISMAILTITTSVVLLLWRRWRQFLLFIGTMASGLILFKALKLLVGRTRPTDGAITVTGASMPSGHATISIIFFGALIYLFQGNIRNIYLRYSFIIGNILLVILIGVSRLYLGVHWFTDIVAGYSLGLFLLTSFILLDRIISSRSGT